MKMLLKTRKAKTSKRGLYIQDKQLLDTKFQIGQKIKYVLDLNKKKIVILPAEDSHNTVAKRTSADTVKPVIDLRKRDVVDFFKENDYLQISIFDEEIVVEGYSKTESSEDKKSNFVQQVFNKAKKVITGAVQKNKKIIDIQDVLSVKRNGAISFSKKQFSKVSGDEQISFDLFDWDIVGATSSKNIFGSVQNSLKNIHIPFIIGSWFCGCGFMDSGYQKEGFEFAYAIEKDTNAAKTYRYNLGHHIIVDDVCKIDKSKLPKVPIMIAGIPCRSFTKINQRKRLVDHPDFLLFKEFIDGIKQNEECKIFMIENVGEFITSLNGYCISEIQRMLPEFELTYEIIDAVEWAPMHRNRSIIIGSKIGKIELPKPSRLKENYLTVRDAFEGITNDLPNQLDVNNHKELTLERMRAIPEGGNHRNLPERLKEGLNAKFSDYLKRLKWDAPSISMVHPRKNLILHPQENRVVSVREICRLFGVDDDFVILGDTLDSRQQQVVNGVVVPKIRAIANVIKNFIIQFNIRNRNIAFV